MKVKSISLIIAMLSGQIALATESDKAITWMQWDDPPIFIMEGPFKGQGLLDRVQEEMEIHLPNYKHTKSEATVLRVLQEAEKKSPTCNAGWLETPEWKDAFHFSKTAFVIPANGILLKESKLKEITSLKPYSLQKILDGKPKWKLGVGRLYGEGIDAVLFKNNYQKNEKVITVPTSLRIHQMLQSDRIQYTLGYPFEATYYNELLKTKDKVVYVDLTDNKDFVTVHVACSKSPWGKKVIEDVNKVLDDANVRKRIDQGVDRWLMKSDRDRLLKIRAI
ncbi:TIGR02285 family protein [Bdellovibrio sp. HCB209]|uniref:TIGR02285 family protein n=1 Tax=Bdellovibrio sp. HCB209 TaxID=3394354 RepID=UPI0039B58ABF